MKTATLLLLITTLCIAQSVFSRRAPGFSLPDSGLKQHDLQDYRGKVLLLDFMKTQCPHCQQVSKVLEELNARYYGRITVVSIVMPPDNQQLVQQYAEAFKISTPFLFDCGQVTASYVRATPAKPAVNLPHLYIIDQKGIIQHDLDYDADPTVFDVKLLSKKIDSLL